MTDTMHMIDSAAPQPAAPVTSVRAFYIGGDTPHPWNDAEVNGITSRYGLPIWVNTNPARDPHEDATAIIAWLDSHKWTLGTLVAIDTESIVMPHYLVAVNEAVTGAGYLLMDYQSKIAVPGNPVTSGGRWVADWTGQPHLRDGDEATQYLPGSMSGNPWDESLIRMDAKLHQLDAHKLPPVPVYQVCVPLPALYEGTKGPQVRNLQALLNAQRVAPQALLDVDGVFGLRTAAALAIYQREHVVTHIPGIAGPATWHALLSAVQAKG